MKTLMRALLTVLIGAWMGAFAQSASAAPAREHWVATWSAYMQGTPFQAGGGGPQTPAVKGQTIRQTAKISVGGPRMRVFISNEFGDKPLKVGAASVAISDGAGAVKAGAIARLTFNGKASVSIPPGVRILSDAADLKTAALQDVTVSLYFPEETPLSTYHMEDVRGSSPRDALASGAILSTPGDFTQTAAMPVQPSKDHVYPPFVSSIQTVAPASTPVVVIFGDTKSEGPGFWPNPLRDRLAPKGIAFANVSQYAGTLFLHRPEGTGLSRFDQNVLSAAGVTHVFLFNASNDVNMPGMANNGRYVMDPSTRIPVEDVIMGIKQSIDRAHAAGLKVIGATLIPFEGVLREGYASADHMQMRDEVNRWIRTSGAFDAVVDFDAAIRDPAHPQRIKPEFDVGNHFTPSAAGGRAMAAAINEALFR